MHKTRENIPTYQINSNSKVLLLLSYCKLFYCYPEIHIFTKFQNDTTYRSRLETTSRFVMLKSIDNILTDYRNFTVSQQRIG